MANSLDEVTGPVNDAGRDVHVIDKQLPVEVGLVQPFSRLLCG